MYSTIAAAIEALPGNGGVICILAGDYYENVVLSGRRNIVIHGCGWQTHIFSESLNPDAKFSSGSSSGNSTAGSSSNSGSSGSSGSSSTGASATPPAESGLPAVFTIVDCENIELRSFSVTADQGEIGILLDRSSLSRQGAPRDSSGSGTEIVFIEKGKGDTDVLLEELILEASTLPAIVAVSVDELKVTSNRIYMKDVACQWAAVYLSGDEMYFEHNWVGLGSATEFISRSSTPLGSTPQTAAKKVNAKSAQKTAETATAQSSKISEVVLSNLNKLAEKTPGGIHIVGPSKNVYIVENEIVGGIGNGITLGNFIILDGMGADTGQLTGVAWQPEQPCSSGGSTQVPGSISTGSTATTSKIGAGGVICNLHIDRNRIHRMGMAGIGVVGFWNLRETLEIIRIVNPSITANVIVRTMLRRMVKIDPSSSGYAYGAISLADVENLRIRDNLITDFGITPGTNVCGIFVLHGEMVEISRNQIRESRDWSADSLSRVAAADMGAGIFVYMVTPPALEGSAWTNSEGELKIDAEDFGGDVRFSEKPLYEPGLPALRVHENVVRVAIGLALQAFGYGPFSIVNNHLSSGGPLGDESQRTYDLSFSVPSKASSQYKDPLLVSIINLGLAIEDIDEGNGFAAMLASLNSDAGLNVSRNLANASCGAVVFTNNTCQLEALMSGVRGLASVSITSLDDVLFNSNLLWLDGPPITSLLDGFVIAPYVVACNNRFQECRDHPVIFSARTVGIANITSQNIASYCLSVLAPANRRVNSPNVILWPDLCESKSG
jgi:hypothetical protein